MVYNPETAAIQNKLLLLRTRDWEAWDVATLIEWSQDKNEEVRDWATFVLAEGSHRSEEVNQALLARLTDDDFDTRSEALIGLARRKDNRALRSLTAALQGEEVSNLMVEAAGLFACEELIHPLELLLPWWDVDEDLLKEALARCQGELNDNQHRWEYTPTQS